MTGFETWATLPRSMVEGDPTEAFEHQICKDAGIRRAVSPWTALAPLLDEQRGPTMALAAVAFHSGVVQNRPVDAVVGPNGGPVDAQDEDNRP